VRISVGLDDSGYKGAVLKKLISSEVQIGDTVEVVQGDKTYKGILMPRSQVGSDSKHIVLKLDSGYNLGIRLEAKATISRLKGRKKPSKRKQTTRIESTSLPTISILSTGGTIASKVDYRTGAVNPALSAQDLYDTVPEIRDSANIQAKIVMSKLSEDIHPSDWTKIARAVASEIRKGVDGVVIAHGTDTLAFTAAALSFALQDLPVPVVLVGSQRSSDRPSSDSASNLIGAILLAAKADAAEVMVLMHAETDDICLQAHRGVRVRKLHTSRRDAFQSINDYPLYEVCDSTLTELNPPLIRRDKTRKLKLKATFNPNVALVKTYPGMSGTIIKNLSKEHQGIVLEGTGLGHAPKAIRPALERAIAKGLVVVMTSQCIFGRVNMSVYRTGVELLDSGVIPCQDMLAETALVKLMWALGNSKNSQKAMDLMQTVIAGEVDMRSEYSEYIINGGE
jgi:glutamyl-tRNA(Gln) amidotransferase subunit D